MKNAAILNKKIIRVMDILEQVEALNEMIALHKGQSENSSMLVQYESMKNEFVKELNGILQEFKIKLPAA